MAREPQPPALDDRLNDMEREAIEIADSLESLDSQQKMWAIYRAWKDVHARSGMWRMGMAARMMMLNTWSDAFFHRLQENAD